MAERRQAPARLAVLTPDKLSGRQREVYESIVSGPRGAASPFELVGDGGSLNGPFNAMLVAPHVGSALEQLGTVLRYESVLADVVRETVILYVAARWHSEFEWYAHSAVAAEVGLPLDVVASLQHEQRPDSADAAVLAAYDVCASLDRESRVREDLYCAARALLGEQGLIELAAIYGYYTALAALLAVFDVGAPRGGDPT